MWWDSGRHVEGFMASRLHFFGVMKTVQIWTIPGNKKRSFSGRSGQIHKTLVFALFFVQQSRTTIYEQKRLLL